METVEYVPKNTLPEDKCVCGTNIPRGNGYYTQGETIKCYKCGTLNTLIKESLLKRIWNKTVFPQMIKDKKEEKEMKRKMKKEAKKEALEEAKEEIKQAYKDKEIAKITGKKNGKKKDIGEKIAKFGKLFEMGSIGSDEKLNKMLGGMGMGTNAMTSPGGTTDMGMGMSGVPNISEKIAGLTGGSKKEKPKKGKKKGKKAKEEEPESPEDKIKRMLYG